MGLFGKTPNIIEEYKFEKPNLFKEFINTGRGIEPTDTLLVPLMNWFSNSKKNLKVCQEINTQFFTVNKKILSRKLALSVDKNTYGLKYPKRPKEEHVLAFLIPYIRKHYGWSKQEFQINSYLIDLEDTELHNFLHKKYAFDKKECRKLGIKIEKIKAKYEKPKPKALGLFG